MKIKEIKRGINPDTFCPTLEINLSLSFELLQDTAALVSHNDLVDILGQGLLDQIAAYRADHPVLERA